jgi:hypothetical protein
VSDTLDLTQVLDRDEVKLPDGTVKELRNPEEFSILQDHELSKLIDRVMEMREKAGSENATDEDAKQASDLLRELATLLVIDLGDTELEDWVCVAIFEFHMRKRIAIAERLAAAQGADPQKPRRTSAARSRGSKRSTAATRKTGSRSRRTS